MWYNIPVEIMLEVEAENDEDAQLKADTICQKRILECEFGHYKNDRARVLQFSVSEKVAWERMDDEGEPLDENGKRIEEEVGEG